MRYSDQRDVPPELRPSSRLILHQAVHIALPDQLELPVHRNGLIFPPAYLLTFLFVVQHLANHKRYITSQKHGYEITRLQRARTQAKKTLLGEEKLPLATH